MAKVNAALQKIQTLAKKIRRQHPAKKWIECIKAAGVQYRKGNKIKKLAPRKKSSTKFRLAAPSKKKPAKIISGFKSDPFRSNKSRSQNLADIKAIRGRIERNDTNVLSRLKQEVSNKTAALDAIKRVKAIGKGLTGIDKRINRKTQLYYGKQVKASMKHITELKKLL